MKRANGIYRSALVWTFMLTVIRVATFRARLREFVTSPLRRRVLYALSASLETADIGSLLTSRLGAENFAGKWQSKGDLYLSFENLNALNLELTDFRENRSKQEKKDLLGELSLTYFARFHNLIRSEYQFERQIVTERIQTWSQGRLRQEGFALFDMYPSPRGALFQDKVYRFKEKDGSPLSFHRFSVGDSVRLSLSRSGDPLSDDSVDGVVLDRGPRFLDICVKEIEGDRGPEIDLRKTYRLDNFVNRISYDRMMNALLLFVQQGNGVFPISRTIRDLILYSYPNSMIALANSPGGLRLGLPNIQSKSMQSFDSSDNQDTVVNAKLSLSQSLEIKYRPQGYQQQKQFQKKVAAVAINKVINSALNDMQEESPRKPFTIADAMARVKTVDRSLKTSSEGSRPSVSISTDTALSSSMYEPSPTHSSMGVFESNKRLRQMAEIMPMASGTIPYAAEEVRRSIMEVLDRDKLKNWNSNLNPSQMSAVSAAILRPLTLIQGPPGTGKVLYDNKHILRNKILSYRL